MSLAQISNRPESVQLAWRFDTETPKNLSLLLEEKARSLRDTAALILPEAEGKTSSSSFRSLGFHDLFIEQNAWVNYLSNHGVKKGDVVVVWLPYSISFLTVSYALFKIGAQAIVLDPEFNWKIGHKQLVGMEAQHMISTKSKLSFSKFLPGTSEAGLNRIAVDNPQGLVGSVLKSFKARSTFWKEEVRLTLVKTSGGRCLVAHFRQDQLCELATLLKDWFKVVDGDRALPGSLLEGLLYPAAGLASLMTAEEFSDSSFRSVKTVINAVDRYGLELVSGEAPFWRTLAKLAQRGEVPRSAKFKAIVRGPFSGDCGLDTICDAMPRINARLVFGSFSHPFIAEEKYARETRKNENDSFRGVYVGEPLPGLQVSLMPTTALRWTTEEGAATEVGEVSLANQDYAPLGDETCWDGSGELGFFDFKGGLWHCGNKADIISSSFGGFCPVRCEAVFNRHPRVKRSILFPIIKAGKTRPGLVVETAIGDIPKRGVEESRFKAELLQIAANCEETSIILDIYFSDRLPLEDGDLDRVDRNRLARDYSRRLRF